MGEPPSGGFLFVAIRSPGAAARVGAPHGRDGRSRPWGAPTDFRAWVADPNDEVEPRSHRPVDPNVGVRTSITWICRPQRWGPNIDHIDLPTPTMGSKHRSHRFGDPMRGVETLITWIRRSHRWGSKIDHMDPATPSMGSEGRSDGVADPIDEVWKSITWGHEPHRRVRIRCQSSPTLRY